MIGVKTTFFNKSMVVVKAVKKAAYNNFQHAAASIRRAAVVTIPRRKRRGSSKPGKPPIQHKPGALRGGIRYYADRQREDAIIGYIRSRVGSVGATHEHGLTEEGRDYPERPVMQPALERNIERFARDWRASIH